MNNPQNNEGIVQSGGTIKADQLAVGRYATVTGTVNKTIHELSTTKSSQANQLADLLKQLQVAIESDPNLKPDDQSAALENLQEIAKAGTAPADGAMQKLVKTASRTLKGMVIELPQATQFVEACSQLLPLITKLFGI